MDKNFVITMVVVLAAAIVFSSFEKEDVTGRQSTGGKGTKKPSPLFIVGAPYFDGLAKPNSGEIHVYKKPYASFWDKIGENVNDSFGFSVGMVGDLDGDGSRDFVVGAPYFDGASKKNVGKVYAYSGRTGKELWTKIEQNPVGNDAFGYSVSGVGDLNGDNKPDVVVGSSHYLLPGSTYGEVFVYSSSGNLLWSVRGEAFNDFFGYAVDGVPDVNGDGKDDIVVGAPFYHGVVTTGKVYLFSGANGVLIWSKEGEFHNDKFGGAVAGDRDMNGDGKGDVVVGAPGWDNSSTSSAYQGKIYVLSGSDGRLLWNKTGEKINDAFGYSVSWIRDTNGDGIDDLIVGAPWFRAPYLRLGKVYALSGVNGNIIWTKLGESVNDGDDGFGLSVSDVESVYYADTVADVIVGAPYFDTVTNVDAGKIYLLSGVNGQPLGEVYGNNSGDMFGYSVSG